MGIKRAQSEGGVSTLSRLVFDLKKRKITSFLIFGTLLLALGVIVLIALKLWIAAILCTILIIPTIIFLAGKVYKIISEQEASIEEMKMLIEHKEEYLSIFSHRIRTPLNNFSFIIEYLMGSNPDGSQKEMLETLIASTSNMVEAVNDLTMMTAQVISYTPRKDINFNLNSALSSTFELFEANKDNSIRFNLEQDDSLANNYLGDPIIIKQIFIDLFSLIIINKDVPTYVNVVLVADGRSVRKENVKFSISTDRAIDALRMDTGRQDKNEHMSVKLIEIIRGTYKSKVSEGSTEFTFTLPLDFAIEEERQSKVAERIRELNTGTRGKKKLSDANILLVEDNPTNQKIVLITLNRLVKNIDTAETGKEALDLFGKSNYDMILMDIQLPVMDGITVARKIREIEMSTSQHTPILAITANAMIGDKEKCLSAGIDEYLSKPFQPAQLIDIIEKFVTF